MPQGAYDITTSSNNAVVEFKLPANGKYTTTLQINRFTENGGIEVISHDYPILYAPGNANELYGFGWDFKYNKKLIEVPDVGSSQVDTVVIRGGNHLRIVFTKAEEGTFKPRASAVFTEVRKTGNVYTAVLRDHSKWTFGGPDKELTSIEDRNGNSTNFTWNSGKLTSIEDDLGRTTTLAYDQGTGLLSSITAPDGRVFQYGYTNGDLTSVTKPATSEYPNGLTITYVYDNDHQITGIKDSLGQQWLTNIYTDGKVTSQTYGQSGQTFTFNYSN